MRMRKIDYTKIVRDAKNRKQPESKRRPRMCGECGKYRADPPSRICVGCEAYKEHQQ